MKIGVIAATGQEGRLIVKEALRRGHEVTAIVRNAEKAKNLGIPVIEKDIFNLRKEDLAGFDAVVSAFGVSVGSGLEFQYQTVGFTLSHLFEQLPDVRILFVGGAASLFTDETMTTRIIESGAIPEAWSAVPYNAWQSFMALQKSSCKWTYFSPALTFDRNGARTGSYKLGTDYVIKNDTDESYISYEDYAIAMVDEIEQGRFIRKRFTAVSNREKTEEAAEKPDELKPEEAPEMLREPVSEENPEQGTVPEKKETHPGKPSPKPEKPGEPKKPGIVWRLFGRKK